MKAPPYRVEETAEGFRATIPASEEYAALWVMGAVWTVWLTMGACLFDGISRALSLSRMGWSDVSGLIFSAGSTLYLTPKGLRAFSTWGWAVYGEETVILGAGTLSLVRAVVGVRRTRAFRIDDVRKLRVVSVPHPLDVIWPLADSKTRPERCAAAFAAGGDEVRFAEGLERTQAETLVKLLISRASGLAG